MHAARASTHRRRGDDEIVRRSWQGLSVREKIELSPDVQLEAPGPARTVVKHVALVYPLAVHHHAAQRDAVRLSPLPNLGLG